jgi:hypothetical protein
VPVVLSLTAMTDQERCFEAGMKDFIGESRPSTVLYLISSCTGKPFTMETLRTKLKKWMPSAAERREHDMQPSSREDQISPSASAAGASDALALNPAADALPLQSSGKSRQSFVRSVCAQLFLTSCLRFTLVLLVPGKGGD